MLPWLLLLLMLMLPVAQAAAVERCRIRRRLLYGMLNLITATTSLAKISVNLDSKLIADSRILVCMRYRREAQLYTEKIRPRILISTSKETAMTAALPAQL